jgi:hypothetical protein
MFKDNNPTAGSFAQITRSEDAVFKGWQEIRSGEVFALYNITSTGHPALGSTVSESTLHKLNLDVPCAPLPEGPIKAWWS